MKFPQGEGSAVIHRKKNDLLYKDATCLCHSFSRLWVLFLVGLFLLALSLAPSSVLGAFSVLFMPSSTELFFLMVLFFLTLRGRFLFWMLVIRFFLRYSYLFFSCCKHTVGLLWFDIVSLSSHCFFRRRRHVSRPVAGWFHSRNRKQVVNRLKIPQGLSTLLFHRWSEVPSRGGVRGDSP